MCTVQRIANTTLDYTAFTLYFYMLVHCLYAFLTCFHNDFFFVITHIYQIPWSSEVIHQELWKADLYWRLLGDLIRQAHIGIPKIMPSLHLSSSLHEGTQTPEPGNPLKIPNRQ